MTDRDAMYSRAPFALIPVFAVLLGMLLFVVLAPSASLGADQGWAAITPGYAYPLEWTTQQVVYTVESSGIEVDGSLMVQFPKSWHLLGPSTDPFDDYFVSASTSSQDSDLAITVTHSAIDGRTDLSDWTTTLTVLDEALSAGDLITYTFGDQSGGGRGASSGPRAMVELVRIAVDHDGDGVYVELTEPPTITTRAGDASYLTVVAPSIVSAGSQFEVAVVAGCWPFNVADDYAGSISFASSDPAAVLPPDYTFTHTDASTKTFTVTLNTPGTHRITVKDPMLSADGFTSNPIQAKSSESSNNLYWGDLHSHTDFSYDAIGPPPGAFEYARDVARLDFYATTDHTYYPGALRYTSEEWEIMSQLVAQYNSPGEFITFLAYEWTVRAPYGHHNIYFRWDDEELLRARDYPTLEVLWAALADKEALTIPHHTGIQWSDDPATSQAVDWSYANERLQTAVEIYSFHGQSELYDPDNPLSYENLNAAGRQSVDGPHYARDAWAAGQKLGVIASGDEHSTRPGQPHFGLTAVYAGELTREAIFDAIANRRTYATTGQRMLLDFQVDEHLMGDSFSVPLPHSPKIEVQVVGTDLIDVVELFKFDGITYTVPYSVSQPGSAEVAFTYTDSDFEQAMYYLRVKQMGDVYGRPALAWSSPVWVNLSWPRKQFFLPLVLGGAD